MSRIARLMVAVAIGLIAGAMPLHAADLTWDAGEDMNWNTTSTNWGDTVTTWNNGTPDNAVFGATGAGTVTLTEPITAATVNVSVGAYTIESATAADTLTVNTLITNSSSSACTISSIIAGDGSLSHTGDGSLTLSGNNSFTGGVYSSGTLKIYNNNAFGTGPVEVNGGDLIGYESLSIYNTITLTNSSQLRVGTNGKTWTQYGDLHLNGPGLSILTDNAANRNASIRGNLYGFGQVSLGRGYIRIYSSCTNHYSGTFRLYRAGSGDTILEIGDGVNLTNDIAIANSFRGNFRRIGLINGSTSNTFSGDISISGSNKATTDDGFQIYARADETITVSGEIVVDRNDEGVDITGGGTVLLTGVSAYNAPTTVRGATLGGDGTIAGTASINDTAIHSPGNGSFGVQTVSNINYEAGSTVIWQLGANSEVNRGSEFDGIDVTGDLDFDLTTTIELEFNHTGSTVDWSDSFWHIPRQWLIWDVEGATTDTTALSLTVADWADAGGGSFNTMLPSASFSVSVTGDDIYLDYYIPHPPVGTLFIIR